MCIAACVRWGQEKTYARIYNNTIFPCLRNAVSPSTQKMNRFLEGFCKTTCGTELTEFTENTAQQVGGNKRSLNSHRERVLNTYILGENLELRLRVLFNLIGNLKEEQIRENKRRDSTGRERDRFASQVNEESIMKDRYEAWVTNTFIGLLESDVKLARETINRSKADGKTREKNVHL